MNGSGGPPPNNGMHPTADTLFVKFLHSCGAAGDAGRWAAALMIQ
jgi:hypothetical protein